MNRNNRNKVVNIIIILLSIVLILLSVCVVILINFNNSNIDKNINKVVEIKAVVNKQEVYGSGTIIGSDGFIITSAHIVTYKEEENIRECKEIYSRLPSENAFIKCNLVNYDYKLDIAKLKVDIDIKGFKLKNRKYKNAEEIYAIGNAMNYGVSITKGIISRKEVKIEYHDYMNEFIQADINASNGCSGGALINKRGELIGLITFRSKDNNNNINYGYLFCIPIKIIIDYFI